MRSSRLYRSKTIITGSIQHEANQGGRQTGWAASVLNIITYTGCVPLGNFDRLLRKVSMIIYLVHIMVQFLWGKIVGAQTGGTAFLGITAVRSASSGYGVSVPSSILAILVRSIPVSSAAPSRLDRRPLYAAAL